MEQLQSITPEEALQRLQDKAESFGFDRLGVLDVSQPHPALEQAGEHLTQWLEDGFHGDMDYMGAHGEKRWRPAMLVPGTTRVIALRMHYFYQSGQDVLEDPTKAYISRYALGRDYHKTFRNRLGQFNKWIEEELKPLLINQMPDDPEFQSRAFVDSAPVMEKATAEAAGLGWIGKNTLVIDRKRGSYFFLGEIYTNLPFATTDYSQELKDTPARDNPTKNHCGRCSRCIEVCPTDAIVAPNRLDARKCISYLTIENKGPIPMEFRKAIGNRIFGCDDCQIFCPWNRFAKISIEDDFKPRHGLDQLTLINGLQWTPKEFDQKTQGSPIRRTGYYGWLRNMAIGAGNHPYDPLIIKAILDQKNALNEMLEKIEQDCHNGKTTMSQDIEKIHMVIEHLDWALAQHSS
ncbi:MAG: tRNA epoxyqueuosine(34) reductase QueG [Pseudomonadota bacterium]|nr:tRNA epoxyqueuosine(34) reductase QueG [Pseudomonadota bacterium]